jgi:predicted double-glycine peptidase
MIPQGTTITAVNSSRAVHGLFLLCLLAALAAGCAARPFTEIQDGLEARGHYINGVPFVRQTGNDCGPAALAAVLSFQGKQPDLAAITASIYLPKLGGTLPMDMERYAKEAGFQTDASSGTLDTLRQAIRINVPVICLLDLGFGLYRQPHYVTVIGFDDGNRLFVLHDGEDHDRTMAYEKFEKAWKRAGNWMIVVAPGW